MKFGNGRLRIVAGTHRGRRICAPGKQMKIRPTSDRVRESLFDILGRRLEGIRVLDLCAGTGALGLESLSRGARSAVFLDADSGAIKLISENIQILGVGDKAQVIRGELPFALSRVKGEFEVVFFDPPYRSALVEKVLQRLGKEKGFLAPNAMVIVERDRRSKPLNFSRFAIDRRHRIGDTELWFLRVMAKAAKGMGGDE